MDLGNLSQKYALINEREDVRHINNNIELFTQIWMWIWSSYHTSNVSSCLFDVNYSITDDIRMVAFKIVSELGRQGALEPEKNREVIIFLRPFFKIILEFILCDVAKCDDALRDKVGIALSALVCCFKDDYREMVVEVLHQIGQPQIEQQIANDLFAIYNDLGLNLRTNQTYKTAFANFVHKVHKLLTL